jgi:hypothetical protein
MSSDLDRPFVRSAALLFATLALALYWPILIGRVPLPADMVTMFPPWESVPGPERATPPHAEMGDLVTELYPWKLITRRAAVRGTLPLWNPYALLGSPFVGDPQSALFYPPNFPFLVLPTAIAWSLAFPIRTFLAGFFTALYARSLGARSHAALYAGVAFAFSGWVTALQPRPHLDAALWLPAVLLAVDRLRQRADGRSAALTAAAFALPVLAGQPECAAHVTFIGLVYFAYRLVCPRRSHEEGGGRARFAGSFVLAGGLALGLASVQILPTLEFIGQLDRGVDAPWGSRPLAEIAAFVSRDLGANPNSAGVGIPEGAAYAGMLTLLLAPIALRSRNFRDAVFFWALLLVILGIVYGFGPFYALSRHVPVLRGIPNWRLLAEADLCLAVLAALGLSAIGDRGAGRPASAVEWVSAAAMFAAAAAGILWVLEKGRLGFQPHPWISFRTIRGPASSAGVLLAAAVFLAFALSGRIRMPVVAALALTFGVVDLLSAGYRFIPFTRPSRIFPPSPTLEFLATDPQPHRVVSIDGASGPGFEQAYGLESPIGFNVVVHRAKRVLSIFGFLESSPAFLSEKIVASRGRLLDLMNVKYLVTTTANRGAERLAGNAERFRLAFSDASVRVFENRTVLPRAFLVPASGIEVVRAESMQFARVGAADFDPSRSVILPEPPPPTFPGESGPVSPPGVSGFVQGINDARLVANVAEPSVLVLSQMHYPGWRVFVDGRPQRLLRADYAFAGVALVPGRHTVRFALEPNSLRIGALISCVSLAAAVALCRMRTSR